MSNNLVLKHVRSVRCGDLALICHAGEERAVVGIAEIIRNPCPDPKNKDARIVIINVASRQELAKPVGLEEIKRHPTLTRFDLVRG